MDFQQYKKIFAEHGGMMRTKELESENIRYRHIHQLLENNQITKVRYGYYQWNDPNNYKELDTTLRLFPDAIICMDNALYYYGYTDRTPDEWHLAVSKHSNKSRFGIDSLPVKPHYVEPALLELGLTTATIDGHTVRIYDRERIICDCLRNRQKMDRGMFSLAVQRYIADQYKSINNLMAYAEPLRVKKLVRDLLEIWL